MTTDFSRNQQWAGGSRWSETRRRRSRKVALGLRKRWNSRVGKGISAQAAPGTVRESLPSYGSYYPIMLLLQSSNDKTTMGFQLVSIDTSYTTYPFPVSYMCSLSTCGLIHSDNKIRQCASSLLNLV